MTEDFAYRADDSEREFSHHELTTDSPLSSISTQPLNPSINAEDFVREGSTNTLAGLFSR